MEYIYPIIRRAHASDALGITTCVEAAYHQYISRIGKPPGPMMDDYNVVIKQHQVFIAEESGNIIGALVLRQFEQGILLDNVAVHPQHQGKGLGRKLIDLAEKEAQQQGYTEIHLYTHELMIENIKLYNFLGYIETERRSERGYQRIYMRKLFSSNIG